MTGKHNFSLPDPFSCTGKHMLKSQTIPMIGALRRLEPILVGDHVDFNQSQIMGTQSPPAFFRLVTCICMCSATRKSLPFSWLSGVMRSGGRGAKNLRHTYIEASGIDHTRTYICCKMATSPPHFRKTGRTSYSIKKRLGTESTTKLLFSWPFVSGHTK